jgi:diguanylate cyclase (GGDEF)-like protein
MGVQMREGADSREPGDPFEKEGLGPRLLPFAVAAVISMAALLVARGHPLSAAATTAAVLLLAATAGLIFLPWQRLPSGSAVIVPIAYTASLLMALLATRSHPGGGPVVLLVPVAWAALHHRRWESGVVLGAATVALLIALSTPVGLPAGEIARTVVLFAVAGGVISLSTQTLRARGHRERHTTARVLRELALNNAIATGTLLERATTDPLTGLPNRRGFDEIVDTQATALPFAILSMDIDGLKQINDTKGHAAGDELLANAAHTLKGSLRRGDVLARLGGDEFAAFLADSDELAARHVAERMLASLAGATSDQDSPGVSIGIAVGQPGDDFVSVYQAADNAMYEAKRQGGRRLSVHGSAPTQ